MAWKKIGKVPKDGGIYWIGQVIFLTGLVETLNLAKDHTRLHHGCFPR